MGLKFKREWPRVVRSSIPERGEAFVMEGVLFEDGLRRVVVGYDVPPETVAELESKIEDDERIRQMVDAVNAMLSNHADGSE